MREAAGSHLGMYMDTRTRRPAAFFAGQARTSNWPVPYRSSRARTELMKPLACRRTRKSCRYILEANVCNRYSHVALLIFVSK